MYIEKLPSGSFRVTVSHNGKRKRGTARTRIKAEQLGGRLARELGAGVGEYTTLGEMIDRHLAVHPYAATTRADYERISVRLGTHRATLIEGLTTGRLVGLYETLRLEGWTPHRVSRLHEVISSTFARAVRLDQVERNPATGASPGRPSRPDLTPPSDEDAGRLLDATPADLMAAMMLEVSTGLRRGELVGVQRRDLNLDTGALAVTRAVAYTPEVGVIVKDLKNLDEGKRVIALDAGVVAALKTHLAVVAADRMAIGAGAPDPSHFVFSRDLGGTPWRPDYVTYRWVKLRKSLNLDSIRFGDLRHFAATSMLSAGEPPALVAGRLGHDPVTLLRRYWHFIPAADEAAAERHAERINRHRAK